MSPQKARHESICNFQMCMCVKVRRRYSQSKWLFAVTVVLTVKLTNQEKEAPKKEIW